MYLIEKIVTIFLQPSLKAFQCHVMSCSSIKHDFLFKPCYGWLGDFLTFYASTFQTTITLNGKQKNLCMQAQHVMFLVNTKIIQFR
jgi:hypothetical protein